uniref:Adiponectin receptor protein n=1 Tax=Trichobilharzia regenti TaxID=157069 RepID=A0AA85K4Q2_TRIRE|nr:unnamed protein product [Trichobilharzia regenti]CAH8839772.1 unnamed protein product [Trichobilharzia regenti]
MDYNEDDFPIKEIIQMDARETSCVGEDEDEQITCAEYLRQYDIAQLAQMMAHSAEEFVRHVWLRGWQVVNHRSLPAWLRDNDFILHYHRPQLNTFWACFKSIFRVHTETGNIWTHLLGCGSFFAIAIFSLVQSEVFIQWQEKLVFSAFFFGAVVCLGFSCLFHTLSCHSKTIGRLFNRLDYTGIAFLNIGSFIPYLYYSFYCMLWARLFYMVLVVVLGTASIIVSMHPSFTTPRYRPLRAGVFMGLGLSALIPCIHTIILDGFLNSIFQGSLGWLVLMAILYLSGATIYAVRVPERIFPGRFDIWFQSHQIFHVFVVAAALVHYHGLVKLADYRLTVGDCKPVGLSFYTDEFKLLGLNIFSETV